MATYNAGDTGTVLSIIPSTPLYAAANPLANSLANLPSGKTMTLSGNSSQSSGLTFVYVTVFIGLGMQSGWVKANHLAIRSVATTPPVNPPTTTPGTSPNTPPTTTPGTPPITPPIYGQYIPPPSTTPDPPSPGIVPDKKTETVWWPYAVGGGVLLLIVVSLIVFGNRNRRPAKRFGQFDD